MSGARRTQPLFGRILPEFTVRVVWEFYSRCVWISSNFLCPPDPPLLPMLPVFVMLLIAWRNVTRLKRMTHLLLLLHSLSLQLPSPPSFPISTRSVFF